jgi:homoserine O-acetyltransferase
MQSIQVKAPTGPFKVAEFGADKPLKLDSGKVLSPFTIAYETYGRLNEDRSNAVLVCHALTGDQFAASQNPVTGNPGWWETLVGPGKTVDTNRYFVICSNVLGGCMGSTGPASLNPATGKTFALDFPMITIPDMVRAQVQLIEHLQIPNLFCVIGGSAGGMQVLEWCSSYKEKVFSAVVLATAAQEGARNIAFHEICRQAIMADPNWHGGRYAEFGTRPAAGLSVARMAAHVNYLSAEKLHSKFGRNLQNPLNRAIGFDADFQIESYLRHQGAKFVERFDANSYLYLTKAIDYFDLAEDHGKFLANAFLGSKTHFCVISFSTDWLQPTEQSKKIVRALNATAANVSFVEIKTENGHDAFLLNEPDMFAVIQGFLDASAKKRELISVEHGS